MKHGVTWRVVNRWVLIVPLSSLIPLPVYWLWQRLFYLYVIFMNETRMLFSNFQALYNPISDIYVVLLSQIKNKDLFASWVDAYICVLVFQWAKDGIILPHAHSVTHVAKFLHGISHFLTLSVCKRVAWCYAMHDYHQFASGHLILKIHTSTYMHVATCRYKWS